LRCQLPRREQPSKPKPTSSQGQEQLSCVSCFSPLTASQKLVGFAPRAGNAHLADLRLRTSMDKHSQTRFSLFSSSSFSSSCRRLVNLFERRRQVVSLFFSSNSSMNLTLAVALYVSIDGYRTKSDRLWLNNAVGIGALTSFAL